jgi:hypothetical protein
MTVQRRVVEEVMTTAGTPEEADEMLRRLEERLAKPPTPQEEISNDDAHAHLRERMRRAFEQHPQAAIFMDQFVRAQQREKS